MLLRAQKTKERVWIVCACVYDQNEKRAKVKLNYVGNTNYYSDYRILASLAARDLAKTWH
jgi:hypothetical protein